MKRARTRPLSEQLLSQSRPKVFYEGDDGKISGYCAIIVTHPTNQAMLS
jgi:hypothetical protein